MKTFPPLLFSSLGGEPYPAKAEGKEKDMEPGDDPSDRSHGNGFRPIRGMDSVIATVSGYHGTERFKLIKLIAHTGASYVGAMTKCTTHLVCLQFEGKKYNLARSTGAHIISHRWFEDCLKEGKRLPENSYAMESGQEAGPITWEVPAFLDVSGKGKCIRSTEQSLFDNSDALDCIKTVDDTRYQNSPELDLLNRQKESNPFPNLCSSSNKRNLYDTKQGDAGGPVRRSSRLKKAYCDLSNYIVRGKMQEICVKKCKGQPKFIDLDPAHENSSRNRSEQDVTEELLDDNIISDCNALSDNGIFSDNDHCEHTTEPFGSPKIGLEDNECLKEADNIDESGAFKKSGVSCVICWTEFCTARAVLPCGHRFCYSCIQGWADCMASKGPTCPLCKASFKNITKLDDASTDQKIYSQTIPYGSSNMETFMFPHERNEDERTRIQKPLGSACYECHYHEPEDLLLCCNICHSQWVHSHCLDSPMFPWTCIHCRDLRTLYRLFR